MSPVPIPYTPKGTPVVDFLPFDGIKFKTVTWAADSDVPYKGKVIFVHGFAEYSTLYTHFFDKLSQEGYEIFFFDQRGAGETSPGAEVGKTDEYHVFNDLDFMIKTNLDKRTNPAEKFVLMGHSMGGGICLNYGIRGKYKEHIRNIVTCGPLVTIHERSQPNIVLRTFAPVVSKLVPNWKIDTKLNYDFITSNEGWKKYIRLHDTKLVGTARQLCDMLNRGEALLKKDYAARFDPDIPLLLLHGTEDNINDFESSRKFFELLSDNVEKKFLPVEGGLHSLFIENEKIFKLVFAEVLDFLEKH